MKKTIALLLLILSINFYGQYKKDIPIPTWEQAKADLKKYESKLLKQVKKYGYETLKGFEFEIKYPDRDNKGAFKVNSYSSMRCYTNSFQKLYDVWPPDWIKYPFIAKAPKNKDGVQYEFSVYVRYSRSKFEGENGCIATLFNKYSFHAINSEIYKVSGNDLSNEKMQGLLFDYIDYWKKFSYYSKESNDQYESKGITKIDSVIFEKNEAFKNSNKNLKEYFVKVYCELAEYDDFSPIKVELIEKDLIVEFEVAAGKKPELKWYKQKNERVIKELDVVDYVNANVANIVGAKKVFQKYVILSVPLASKKSIKHVSLQLEKTLRSKGIKGVKDDKELNNLFKSEEDLTELAAFYNEITNGLWTINTREVILWSDINYHKEGKFELKLNIERNLTKEQIKSIKDKVSKDSLKNAKYHMKGNSSYTIYYVIESGELKIKNIDGYNSIKIVR